MWPCGLLWPIKCEWKLSLKELVQGPPPFLLLSTIGWANYRPQPESSPLQIFINKVLSEHSHAHPFTYRLWLFACYNSRAEQLQQRPYGLQNPKYLPPGPLQKKYENPCSQQWGSLKQNIMEHSSCWTRWTRSTRMK